MLEITVIVWSHAKATAGPQRYAYSKSKCLTQILVCYVHLLCSNKSPSTQTACVYVLCKCYISKAIHHGVWPYRTRRVSVGPPRDDLYYHWNSNSTFHSEINKLSIICSNDDLFAFAIDKVDWILAVQSKFCSSAKRIGTKIDIELIITSVLEKRHIQFPYNLTDLKLRNM